MEKYKCIFSGPKDAFPQNVAYIFRLMLQSKHLNKQITMDKIPLKDARHPQTPIVLQITHVPDLISGLTSLNKEMSKSPLED